MTETIKFSDWQKIDLRTAKILSVDSIEGADKLYKLSLDLGKELGKRELVAGLKPYYKAEELVGKTCIIFANLEPKKLKGIESQGMLLAAVSGDESKVLLLQPEKDIEPGSKIR
jgi:methionine--tRNA ligase beta chain